MHTAQMSMSLIININFTPRIDANGRFNFSSSKSIPFDAWPGRREICSRKRTDNQKDADTNSFCASGNLKHATTTCTF